ncbi:hypothetical protein [Hymenobacter sp. YC55]|uniref:hypothetical protein n=1 Tax=Hymenobacter sp. YC55 TaxID=3034019 RepID=UPI0023F806BF|nr:hypothetical protein [Hymenobacter sp. YC55]MDF7813523.1 hypothetical protein [Hymenobacter sp. YC55]
MKHLFNILPKLTAIAAVALSISSCNRAEYAMLPKTTPYHATYGTTKTVPAPATASEKVAATEAPVVEAPAKSSVAAAPAATAPATTRTNASVAAAPAKAKAAKTVATTAPRKPNLVQRLAVAKMLKQVDKATTKVKIKKHTEAAGANRLEGKLRQGVILLLAGLLIEILGAATGIGLIYVLGAIVAIIGIVLIILYLLDEL